MSESEGQPELIWIRSTVECGLQFDEEFHSIPHHEWVAMTQTRREDYLVEVAEAHQNEFAPCGAEVVEPGAVPEEWKRYAR